MKEAAMTTHKIIITDCDHENIDIETRITDEQHFSLEYLNCKTEEDVIAKCQGAPVFLNQYAPITERVLANLPDLKLVVRYGVGVNNIDLKAADQYGVQICNVPDYGTNEVADHALALMLSMTRKIPQMSELVRKGIWDYQKSIPIYRHSEQTVGVIGLGRIGTSFARKVQALGCRVIVCDSKYKDNQSRKLPDGMELVELDELLEQSDIVSLHCPLESAHNLIDEQQLRKMKSSAYLINVSRGGIINEDALFTALQEGWIAGAAADVAEKEPLSAESPLLQQENFLCTPHMAWYSEQAALELKRKVAEEAVRFLKGKPVHYPINEIHNLIKE
jgi:D-3-phosphoglycerate dehydrogenase / 2-oxoglutarate reductase